jgi:rubrerythrin
LLQTIERHAAAESEALGQYEYLARASEDAVIALIMRLILDDEVRHHALLERMATSLRDALYWTHSPDALPKSSTQNCVEATELQALAQGLIEEEKAGAETLRRIATREKRLDSGFDSVLLEMMAIDSEKHAHLLRFVERRLRTRARNGVQVAVS